MNIRLKTQAISAARPLAGRVSLVTGSTSGIGLGIARALAEAGVGRGAERFRLAAEIARTRDQMTEDYGVEVTYSAADMTKTEAIAGDDRHGARRARPARRRSSTMPAFSMSRRSRQFPVEKWDAILRSTCRRRSTPCGWRCPRCAQQVRADHQHRLRARTGRLALQVGLCRRQARHRRADQGRRAGDRRAGHHLQRDLPGLRLHPAGRGADRRPGQGARHLRASRSSATCCWRSSRTSASPRSRSSARSRVPRQRRGGLDHRRRAAGRRRLDRALRQTLPTGSET